MTEVQLERQSIAYHSWLQCKIDFYPHTLNRMGHRKSPFITGDIE